MTRTALYIATFASLFLFGPYSLLARDFHFTAQGSGARDGSSWGQAFASERLQLVLNETMQPGDRLLLGGGIYPDVALVSFWPETLGFEYSLGD